MNNFSFKFYGRRKGRGLNKKQIQINDPNENNFYIKAIDLKEFSPLTKNILEIGFGNGENLLKMSKKYINSNFLGADPYINSCLKLCKNITENNLKNIKIWSDDIRNLMYAFPKNIFDLILILHPDPWQKKKHVKRRLIQQYFIDFLAKIIKKNGKILFASDENNMKSWILEQFHIRDDFEWQIKKINYCSKKPSCLINSKYSKKAISNGEKINWFIYKKL